MSVFFSVKAIIRRVKFIIGMIKGDFRLTEKLATDIPYSAFAAPVLICFAIAFFFVGDAVTLGSAFFPFILIALLIGLMRIVDFVIFDCKSNMAIINTVTKKALTLITLILALVFIFNFAGLGIYGEMTDTYETYHETRSDELLERTLAAVAVWNDPDTREVFTKKIMKTDFSWNALAFEYEKLYNK